MTANVQPIFIKTPFIWNCELSNQTVPGVRVGSSIPQLIGTAGPNGGLVEEIFVQKSGDHGTTAILLFASNQGSTGYIFCGRQVLQGWGYFDINDDSVASPISLKLWKLLSPASCDGASPHTGLRLPPGASLYSALTIAIDNPLALTAIGGNY